MPTSHQQRHQHHDCHHASQHLQGSHRKHLLFEWAECVRKLSPMGRRTSFLQPAKLPICRPAHFPTCRSFRLGRSLPFRTPLNGLDKKQGARREVTQRPAGREGRDDDRGREVYFLAAAVFFAAARRWAWRRWRTRRARRWARRFAAFLACPFAAPFAGVAEVAGFAGVAGVAGVAEAAGLAGAAGFAGAAGLAGVAGFAGWAGWAFFAGG